MEVYLWGYIEVVGTLKPYLMQKYLFELFALTGSEDAITSDSSVHTICSLPETTSHQVKFPLANIFIFWTETEVFLQM